MRRSPLLFVATAVLAVASGCATGPADAATVFGGDRPASLVVPSGYAPGDPTPLLVALHGYGSTGSAFATGTGLLDLAETEGYLLLAPDGTPDRLGARFWDATEACCNFEDTPVDDVAYLTGLVEDVAAEYSVDPARVHVVGFSNGAFMAHRLACERPDLISSIVAVAGSIDPDRSCSDVGVTSVLSVHGTEDSTINYEGGAGYPGAEDTTSAWARDLGCGPGEEGDAFDLDTEVPGPETRPLRHEDCRGGAVVALWVVEGADHGIAFSPDAARMLWAWLGDHATG